MNIIYNKISLDIHNIASQLTLAVKKGDTARGLIITLTDNGKVYNIPDYCYATFSAKKSDDAFVSTGCQIKDNKIIYDFSPQLTTMPGRVDCEASLFSKNAAQITSPLFTLYVYRTIKDEYEEEIASSDEFKTLDRLISETTEVLEESKATLEESKEAISAANESVTFIERTEDGKLKLLNFDREEIITVDVFCGDDDTLYRYNDGMLSVVGIKERNKDKTFGMWVGTQAEYNAIRVKDPETMYYITDETLLDDILSGVIKVGRAVETDQASKVSTIVLETYDQLMELIQRNDSSGTYAVAINDKLVTIPNVCDLPYWASGMLVVDTDAVLSLTDIEGNITNVYYDASRVLWIVKKLKQKPDEAGRVSTIVLKSLDQLMGIIESNNGSGTYAIAVDDAEIDVGGLGTIPYYTSGMLVVDTDAHLTLTCHNGNVISAYYDGYNKKWTAFKTLKQYPSGLVLPNNVYPYNYPTCGKGLYCITLSNNETLLISIVDEEKLAYSTRSATGGYVLWNPTTAVFTVESSSASITKTVCIAQYDF